MRIVATGLLLPLAACAAAVCGGHGDRLSMLVSTVWLADRLHDRNLTIVAVSVESDYSTAHIPGVVALDYRAIALPISAERLDGGSFEGWSRHADLPVEKSTPGR